MKLPSQTIKFLASKFGTLFSREAVEHMVIHDEISTEAAGYCLVQAEAASNAKSAESSGNATGVLTDPISGMGKEGESTLNQQAAAQYFANAKFEAMLAELKEDNTLLHDEFVSLDNARNKAIAEIVATRETDFNMMLQSLRTADGVDKTIIDNLLQTKLRIEDIR